MIRDLNADHRLCFLLGEKYMKSQKILAIPLYNHLCKTAYCIQKKDLIAAAKVIAAAFSDDASIRYLLGGKTEGRNDWKYFFCVLKAIYGKCVMLSADERIDSVLILFPPQLKAVPTMSFLLNGGIGLCPSFGISLYLRSLHYENNCQAVKNRYGTPDTWYCMCFVVSPQMQRQGIGSRLIKPVLKILECNHIPLYLETHKAVNADIYKHFGFETVEISTIPKTSIIQYSMMKENTCPQMQI